MSKQRKHTGQKNSKIKWWTIKNERIKIFVKKINCFMDREIIRGDGDNKNV